MSGRDPKATIRPGFRCDYAERGHHACPAWRCDCFDWIVAPSDQGDDDAAR